MPILADCHLHSHHSGDSNAPMEAQILAAMDRGLSYLCFTEHYDPFFPYDKVPDLDPGTFELDLASYRREFLEMRDRHAGSIRVLGGIELGVQPHLGPFLNEFVRSLESVFPELDQIIGSCHLCFGTDPYDPSFLDGHTEEEAVQSYLSDTLSDIRAFSEADTWGHLDYVVRCLPRRSEHYTYERYKEYIDPILSELIDRGIALEINTAPLARGMGYFHPLPEILRRYRELGGEMITVGSDAHTPGHVGGGFAQASSALRELGYKYYTVFEHRNPCFLDL